MNNPEWLLNVLHEISKNYNDAIVTDHLLLFRSYTEGKITNADEAHKLLETTSVQPSISRHAAKRLISRLSKQEPRPASLLSPSNTLEHYIYTLYNAGDSTEKIAKQLGVSKSTATLWIRKIKAGGKLNPIRKYKNLLSRIPHE